VNETEQLPETKVHEVGLNDPPLFALNSTVPVGVTGVPPLVSVTVALQVVGALTASGFGVHTTLVALARAETVSESTVELPMCRESPEYAAFMTNEPSPPRAGVNVTLQADEVPLPVGVHIPDNGVNAPDPVHPNETVPVGGSTAVGLSFTVAEQVAGSLTTSAPQLISVVVPSWFAESPVVPELESQYPATPG
jgi:hypothetical protein